MVELTAAIPAMGETPKLAIVATHLDLVREIARTQVDMLATAAAPGLEAAGMLLRRLVQALSDDRWSAPLEAALREARAQRSPDPLRVLVAGFGENSSAPMPVAAATPQPVPVPAVSGTIEPPPAEPASAAPRVLRVDQSMTDAIMKLVAEMIIAKNGLSCLATRAEQVHESRAVAERVVIDNFVETLSGLTAQLSALMYRQQAGMRRIGQENEATGAPLIWVIGQIQFQDIIRQQLEQLSTTPRAVDQHLSEPASDLVEPTMQRRPSLQDRLDGLFSAYVMDQQRVSHRSAEGQKFTREQNLAIELF